MKSTLSEVISELKSLSGGRRINVVPPDDELIAKYENEIGFKFSEDFIFFLREASTVFFGTKSPVVVTSNKSNRNELSKAIVDGRKMGLPKDWLPICEDNGNYYCIDSGGQIRFWSGDGPSYESWPDLATWVKDVWIGQG